MHTRADLGRWGKGGDGEGGEGGGEEGCAWPKYHLASMPHWPIKKNAGIITILSL